MENVYNLIMMHMLMICNRYRKFAETLIGFFIILQEGERVMISYIDTQ